VPLISSSYGAFQETVLEGVTGYRCHTLADWVAAIQLSRTLDRRRIAELARSRYSMNVIGKQYDWALRQLSDLSSRGWYSDKTRKFANIAVPEQGASKHALQPQREPGAQLPNQIPRVLLAILAKQKAATLPLYLRCIEALDYPKSAIVIYIRTNNNTDETECILSSWISRVGHQYAAVEMVSSDVPERVQDFAVHEWNATRFTVLGNIRAESLHKTFAHRCDFYFTADVDNFLRPDTLKELVALDLPIVAPFLRLVDENSMYSNYHADIDANGYYKACDRYDTIFSQVITGIIELPVVHCTYLVRASCISNLTYNDNSARHEYVIFSESARKSGTPQYLDNRRIYGYLTLKEEEADKAAKLIGPEVEARLSNTDKPSKPAVFTSLGHPDVLVDRGHAPCRSASEVVVQKRFTDIYQKNEWGFGSGVGSLPINNIQYMEFVQSFIEESGIGSVVDFGCGDWQFSRFMNWNNARYMGVDLVESVVEGNRKAFERPGVSFELFKGLNQLPTADLLLCKDVFQHLPNGLVQEYMAAFKQKFKFLLITNDDRPESQVNHDIDAGGWRPIRLEQSPFSERAPIVLSWMITWGGWTPTHKATCLINGDADTVETPAAATGGMAQQRCGAK
jgi:SAM-dependent methyltransferase